MAPVPTDFDELAPTYDNDSKVERSRAIAAAIAAAVPLSRAMTALDYGCGTGLVSWELADRLGHVTLADSSAGMREVTALRLAARDDADRFDLVALDLATQPAPSTYDLVYSSLVLHHIEDTRAILAAMLAALRPGGWLAIADLDHDHGNHFHPDDFGGHTGFHRDALAADAVAAGFPEPRFRTATRVSKHKDGVPHTFDVFLMTAQRPAQPLLVAAPRGHGPHVHHDAPRLDVVGVRKVRRVARVVGDDPKHRPERRDNLPRHVDHRVVLGQDDHPGVGVSHDPAVPRRPRRPVRPHHLAAGVEDGPPAGAAHDPPRDRQGDLLGGAGTQLELLRVIEHVDPGTRLGQPLPGRRQAGGGAAAHHARLHAGRGQRCRGFPQRCRLVGRRPCAPAVR